MFLISDVISVLEATLLRFTYANKIVQNDICADRNGTEVKCTFFKMTAFVPKPFKVKQESHEALNCSLE